MILLLILFFLFVLVVSINLLGSYGLRFDEWWARKRAAAATAAQARGWGRP